MEKAASWHESDDYDNEMYLSPDKVQELDTLDSALKSPGTTSCCAFSNMDKNGDGRLSEEELALLYEELTALEAVNALRAQAQVHVEKVMGDVLLSEPLLAEMDRAPIFTAWDRTSLCNRHQGLKIVT